MSEPTSDEQHSSPDGASASANRPLPDIPGYRLLESLGRGAMGSVYLAIEESLNRRVAVKLLTRDFAQKDGAQEQFEREARTMATVEHPHVVRVYAFGDAGRSSDHQPYLAMELVEGETLEGRIERQGRLPLAEALRICHETAEALRAAWRRKIVHRDVKPGNILLDEEGRVRVGDFGIAKPLELEDGALTSTGCSLGTPRYISPEQASGEAIDFRSDIYSLGVVLWEMLVGHAPFRDANAILLLKRHLLEELPALSAAGVEVPPAVERLVARMTAKKREERYESYDELLRDLAADGARDTAPPDSDATGEQRSGQWYYMRGGDRRGPVAYAELVRLVRAGEIAPSARVWGPGFDAWRSADSVDGLVAAPATTSEALSLLSAQGAARSVLEEMLHAVDPEPSPPAVTTGAAPIPATGAGGDRSSAPTEVVLGADAVLPVVEEEPDSGGATEPELATAAAEAPESPPAVATPAPLSPPPAPSSGSDPGPPAPEAEERRAAPDRPSPAAPPPAAAKSSAPPTAQPPPSDAPAASPAGPSPADAAAPGGSRLVFWDAPLGVSGDPGGSAGSTGLESALDAVEVKLNVQREDLRRQEMRRSSVKVRFEQLKQEVLKPAFRDVMVRFHAKGYPSRLKEVGGNEVRLEFTVDSAAHCRFEVELTDRGTVAFRYLRNMRDVAEEEVPIDKVDAAGIERRIADLLVKALGVR